MKLTKEIVDRLSKFFDSYRQKVNFLKNLACKRKAENEIILLVCCYLDQLGGCLFPEEESSKCSFERILSKHSGENDEFALLSIPDLAFDILWMAEFASVTIPKPGRIQLLANNLKPLLKFTDQSDIALTEESVRKLFVCLYDSLKSNFRVHPYQTKNKSSYGSEGDIRSIITCPELRKIGANITEKSAKELVKEYTYASILYREYRCKAVHEVTGIHLDTSKFWNTKRPYFVEVGNDWLPELIFKLEFPASFLIECLETCVKSTEKAIIGKGLVPHLLWSAICNLDETEFLDAKGMEEAKPIKLRIE
jgi:hypothetical protein